jgi:hypothetical protein
MSRPKKQKLGDCYEAAGRFMMLKGMLAKDPTRYRLVHAEVAGQGGLEGVTYGHGFVVDTEAQTVIDKSNGRDLELPVLLYYTLGKIDEIGNIHEYTYSEMAKKITRHGHWGPWDLETSSGY